MKDNSLTANELRRLFPRASESVIKANCHSHAALHTGKQKQPEGKALERVPKRKDKSSLRFKIVFRVYAFRPMDWDNPYTKPLQDILVLTGLLPGDSWRQLRGEVIPEKAKSEEEEKTVVEIYPCPRE